MATIPGTTPSPSGKRSSRSRFPKIDFTPMVDLGFLLITFFMLSTSLSKPHVMPIVMPDTKGEPEPVKASKTITLLLDGSDKVYCYPGQHLDQLEICDFQTSGLRKVLLDKMQQVATQFGLETHTDPISGTVKQGSFTNVIIKPCPDARYKNLVDAIDEMNICHIRYYCIVDPGADELQAIAQKKSLPL